MDTYIYRTDHQPPSHPHNHTQSFSQQIITVFQVLGERQTGSVTLGNRTNARTCTRTHAYTTHTRTHILISLWVFLLSVFFFMAGNLDSSEVSETWNHWVHLKPGPHTFPLLQWAQPSRHMANPCSSESPYLGVQGDQVWPCPSRRGSQRHLSFYPAEHPTEAKIRPFEIHCACPAD